MECKHFPENYLCMILRDQNRYNFCILISQRVMHYCFSWTLTKEALTIAYALKIFQTLSRYTISSSLAMRIYLIRNNTLSIAIYVFLFVASLLR